MRNIIKIGTEFTFSNKEHITCTLEDLKRNHSNVAVANEKLKAYTSALKRITNMTVDQNTILNKVSEAATVHKKFENSSYNAVAVCFELYDKVKKKSSNWYVNFDLDPFCIELQTQPVTYEFYNTYKALLNQVIFGTAKRCELYPDPNPDTGGGGHISLDVATAFQNNPVYLRNFMVLYENVVRDKTDWRNEILVKCQDIDNAPFLHEINELEVFRWNLGMLDSSAYSMKPFVNTMQREVYRNLTATLAGMGVNPQDAPHYQAINLENVLNPDVSQRRVELRRFNAQANIDELLRQLDILFNLIEEASTNTLINLH